MKQEKSEKIVVFTYPYWNFFEEELQCALDHNYTIYLLSDKFGPFSKIVHETTIIYGEDLLNCYKSLYSLLNLPITQLPIKRLEYYPEWNAHLPRFNIETARTFFDIWRYYKYGIKPNSNDILYKTAFYLSICEKNQ